jgi:hypothetical protein
MGTIWEWIKSLLQSWLANLLWPVVVAVVAIVMTWAKARDWSWATPLFYGVVTAACLYILFGGVNRKAIMPHVPATVCEMRIGRKEHLQLANVLRQVRSHHPNQEVIIIVEPGQVDSCPYAYDLRALFHNAGWKPVPVITDRGEELIERDVWFYGPPNDVDAQGFCESLKTYGDPAITCKKSENSPNNAWEFYIKD